MAKATRFFVLVALILVGAVALFHYWTTGVGVPNLQTLTIPEAEAALNRAGLRLGNIDTVDEENNSGTPDTVVGQSAPQFWRLPVGSTVDITVLRTNNVLLIYNQPSREEAVGNTLSGRWFNVKNLTNELLYVGDLSFASAQDESLVLEESAWDVDEIAGGFCLQILPDELDRPIEPPECESMLELGWFSIPDPQGRFWDQGESFYVYQDGIPRATCQIADDRCEFWIEEAEVSREIAGYFYFVYDQDRFAVFNRSTDGWMILDEINIGNLNLGREQLQPLEFLRASDLDFLAPQQCILLSANSEDVAPFPGCVQVIGRGYDVEAFWREDFRVSGTDCLAATDETTICMVPRN